MKKTISTSFLIFNLIFTQFITGQNSQKNSSEDLLGEKVDSIIQMGIREKAFPGAQVLIFKKKSVHIISPQGTDKKTNVINNHVYKFLPPQMINEKNPKLYDDIEAGEFLRERLVALGLL